MTSNASSARAEKLRACEWQNDSPPADIYIQCRRSAICTRRSSRQTRRVIRADDSKVGPHKLRVTVGQTVWDRPIHR